jgi:hypothetical protein
MRSNGGHAQHDFSTVASVAVERSSFNRSHGCKLTFNPGYIYPVFCDEVLPGDTHNLQMTAFIRMTTALHPLMDNAYVDSHFFFVPNRLVWEHWRQFMGQVDNPGATPTVYTVPRMKKFVPEFNTIYDYYGVPVQNKDATIQPYDFSSLPLRGYNIIYDEWFRDENLQPPVSRTNIKFDGPDEPANYRLMRRGKRHDYFTSCLPWAQKGDPVPLPGLGAGSVITTTSLKWEVDNDLIYWRDGTPTSGLQSLYPVVDSGLKQVHLDHPPINNAPLRLDLDRSAIPKATSVSVVNPAHSGTINQLREAFQIQKMLETDARGGTRYIEMIKAHFGVTSSDSRLQRPEYLGGGSSPLHIQQVAQTSATNTTVSPQGHLTGYGTVSVRNHGFTQSFDEHGFLHGFISVRADLTYHQGLHKMWSRETREEHYFPLMAHLGEQAVLNKEIYVTGQLADEAVFGYQERWAEYRYKQSTLHGLMRCNVTGSLDAWHLAQNFKGIPTLSRGFIQEKPPFKRAVAVQNQPIFIGDFYFDYISARPMPVYSVPGFTNHF